MSDEFAGDLIPLSAPRILIPALIANVGTGPTEAFLEFFAVGLINPNTRLAYHHAADGFMAWFDRKGIGLKQIKPIHVAAYFAHFPGSPRTKQQHLAAIRMLFSWFVERGALEMNPARDVRSPKFSRIEGKTPAFETEEVQKILNAIDVSDLIGLRDKALIATLAYTFARITAVVSIRAADYLQIGKRSFLRFVEKGGKEKEIPVHHKLEEVLDVYLARAQLRDAPGAPIFQSARGRKKEKKLSGRPLSRTDAAAMVRRRNPGRWYYRSVFTTLIQGDRHHKLLGKRWQPRSRSTDCWPCL
jgi:integrase/recombinase XerD